jgi:hypothetical protein
LDPDRKVPNIKVELPNGVESRHLMWEGLATRSTSSWASLESMRRQGKR